MGLISLADSKPGQPEKMRNALFMTTDNICTLCWSSIYAMTRLLKGSAVNWMNRFLLPVMESNYNE